MNPTTPQLVRWLLSITKPVHPPLLVSLVCRIANLILDLVLFGLAAGGVVHLITVGDNVGAIGLALVATALAKAAFY